MPPSDKSHLHLGFRSKAAMAVIAVVILIFSIRLWYLQIINGDYYREQSENNRLQTLYVAPPRGLILDRNGVVLAKNRPSFNIELVPENAKKLTETVENLARFLSIEAEPLLERVRQMPKRRRFEPRILVKDVTRDQIAIVMARKAELPGVIITAVPAREYPFGNIGAHILGYVREITKEQLEKPEYSTYRINDIIGQYGLEAKWERYLQGKRGIRRVIVNAMGTKLGEASSEAEIAGHSMTVSIDIQVQKAADKALEGKKGAIVALDVNTGEVLALASAPTFDPNIFTGEIAPSVWKDLTTGAGRALTNRVVQGAYPPGSVFKIWMAIAGLSEGVVGLKEGPTCGGGYFFAGRTYHCHKRSGHGPVNLFSAMVQSCDVYFYVLGQRLGVDRIYDYSSQYGLGEKTGLELVDEAEGLIPSTAWKARYFKNPGDKKWYPGETLSVAIGQGATLTTPLQIARSLAAVVNGGKVLQPHLIKKVASLDGGFIDEDFPINIQRTIDADQKVVTAVREALVGVVNDPRGTAKRASLSDKGIVVAGKTGTAQVVSLDFHKEGGHFDHHAWFAGYAPAENPKIVVVALVENGGHGGAQSAPLVKQVMEAYFGVQEDQTKISDITGTEIEVPEMPIETEGEPPSNER